MAMDRSSRPMHRGRKKVCSFCVDRIDRIDYKDQRELTVAIKRARYMALMPYVSD